MYLGPGGLKHWRQIRSQGQACAAMPEDRGPRARWCRDMRKLAIGTCNEMNKEL